MALRSSLTNDPVGIDPWTPGGVGPYLPVTASDVDVFNEIVGDEIDSSYSSSIACCDFCYDDFKAHWPDVAFRELEFQTQSVDAHWFVEYSRLVDIYTPAEVSTLREFIRCDRCARYGSCNLWFYEHRFSGSDDLEEAIDELLAIGSTMPFLLLEHELAVRVLAEIRRQAEGVTPALVSRNLYRARSAADVARLHQDPTALATYAPPPAPFVAEGRFNHAGAPMLYLASAPAIAASELGSPGLLCHVATLRLTAPLKILDLVELDEEESGFELMQALASSALLSAPRTGEGWLRRQYVFSRFVADCARSAGFDVIRYGSTKQRGGDNLVVLVPPEDVRSLMTLVAIDDLEADAPARRY